MTEEPIIWILHEAETGLLVVDACRKYHCSEQLFYRGKTKYVGMGIDKVKYLKKMESENAELKRVVAEQALDIGRLKKTNRRKGRAWQSVGAALLGEHLRG